MPLKLYKIDGSGPVRTVLMTIEALQLKIETQNVNIMTGDHLTPEFLDKNPAHTVPLLEDDDFHLADSHAIITYLVSKYGDEEQSKLYPNDLRTRATINQRLFYEATVLTSATGAIVYGILRHGQTDPTPQQIEAVNAAYEILDRYLQKTKYVACDHVTLADIACVASITTAGSWVPVDDKYTKIKAWLKTLQEEDWYKKGNLPQLQLYRMFMKTKYSKISDSD